MEPLVKRGSNVKGILFTLVTAIAGAALFKLLHGPIPWLLGPMIAVLIGSSVFKVKYVWPGQLRNSGMIIVGYTIGLSMTGAALREMAGLLPSMLLMTLLLLILCAGIAYIVSRLSNIDYKTALMGSIPGGLTQIVALAEETKGVDLTIVTVTQVIRLMLIIVSVPLLVFSPIFGGVHNPAAAVPVPVEAASWAAFFPNGVWFAIVCVVCALAGNRIKFPTAFLLGPAIGTAVLQGLGMYGPALPPLLLNAAQLLIGAYIGLLLKPGKLTQKLRTITLAATSGLLLIAVACGLSELLAMLHTVSPATALLSLAPGGMDQMGILAHEIDADLSMVAGYQLFRTFFIFFLVPPLLRFIFHWSAKRVKQTG
ncbi:AbrB family transcriptional regulator [Paenibacillus pinihumi]|uniref:AbrB family transcriptional regulator n=1 Tax=Paenibacillus pinihumi TaxID=669462 RepID=UPI00040C4538|nr:AbrB family transcriptional regulator [Paenibacillus pinihumi]